MNQKVLCENRRCRWVGDFTKMLTAPNPFEDGEMLYACPSCKDIGSCVVCCDEPECNQPATCGTPTKVDGRAVYRNTCSKHRPKDET